MRPTSHKESRASSRNIRVLGAVASFIRPYRWQATVACIALIATAAMTLSLGQGLRLLVDQGFGAHSAASLNRMLFLFTGIVSLLAIGMSTRFYWVSWIGERVVADIRQAVFRHIIELQPSFFETNLSGEIQSRITTDTTLLQTVIGTSVSMALRNGLLFIGGLIWMLITNAKLTGIVLLSVPIVMIPLMIFGKRLRRLSRASQDEIAHVGGFVGEAIKQIKVLQAFNHQKRDSEQFAERVETAFQVGVRRITHRAWLTVLVIMLVFGTITAMLWVGGHDVIAHRISAGELTAFVFYAVIVAMAVAAIGEVYGSLQRAAGATERLLELLHADNAIQSPDHPTPLATPVQGHIDLHAIRFYYTSRPNTPAIDGISLTIPAGRSLALVGSSGAGKSTVVDLLLRFYDVQEGSILWDGIDIRHLDLQQLRDHIALVPQQPILFSTTVIENIRYGRADASDKAIVAAAKAAHAHDFIEKLPQGYHSFVGESGVRLSGGQSQRIAIARAILKNPTLLLLDEATSALDAESEHHIQQALNHLLKGRTSIIIAHRLATVVHAHQIAVLDHGKLVATGSHQELLSRSPLYARWAQLQFHDKLKGK